MTFCTKIASFDVFINNYLKIRIMDTMNFWRLWAAVSGCVYFIILLTVVWIKVFQKAPQGYGGNSLEDNLLSKKWNRGLSVGILLVMALVARAVLDTTEFTIWKVFLSVVIWSLSVIFKWLMVLIFKLISLFFYSIYWDK